MRNILRNFRKKQPREVWSLKTKFERKVRAITHFWGRSKSSSRDCFVPRPGVFLRIGRVGEEAPMVPCAALQEKCEAPEVGLERQMTFYLDDVIADR